MSSAPASYPVASALLPPFSRPTSTPVLHIAILVAASQKPATLRVDLIACHSSHHSTSYRISVTALICCCFFHFLIGLDTALLLLSHSVPLPAISNSVYLCLPLCCPIDCVCAPVPTSAFNYYLPRDFSLMWPVLLVILPLRCEIRESLHSAPYVAVCMYHYLPVE